MTAETKGAPSIVRAITPARDLVKDDIVALQANPKNFSHIMASRDTARFKRGLNRGASVGQLAAEFANHGNIDPQLALLDCPVRHQGSIDNREPAKHAPATKPLRQNVDVSHPIQQGYDNAPLGHGRSNGVHGPIKIVGLAGQKNNIEGPIQLTLLDNLGLCTELTAVLCSYYQAIPLKLGSALWPDQKSHVSPALDKHSAKISSERASAQYQVPHLLPPM